MKESLGLEVEIEELVNCVIFRKTKCLPSFDELLELFVIVSKLGSKKYVERVVRLLLLQPSIIEKLREELGFEKVKFVVTTKKGGLVFTSRVPLVKFVKFVEKPDEVIVNLPVLNGYVYLNKKVEEEILKNYLLEKAKEVDEVDEEKVKRVRQMLKIPSTERRERIEKVQGKVEKCFPPCIRTLLSLLREGQHLTHEERFHLATFLLNVGYAVDEVLELFKSSPDFNEKVARYQIEHLAGLRGSKKKYKPFNCDNARSRGICTERCKGIKNPLSYYSRCVRRVMNERTQNQGNLSR